MKSPPPATVQSLPLADLDAADRSFAVTPDWDLPQALLESVRAVGVVSPLRVLRSGARFRIVSGFRRFNAARAAGLDAVPCLILEAGDRNDRDWFVEALGENLGTRSLSELERGLALEKLGRLGVSETELIQRHLPALGLRADRRHLLQALKTARLPTDLQRALPDLILEAALKLAAWEPEERTLFLDLQSRYRLGRNRQRELLELLDELRASEKRSDGSADVGKVWRASGAEAIDSPEDSTPSRIEQILDRLRRLRYPILQQTEARARQLQSALRLPPEIQFNLPRHFEGDRISIQFSARQPEHLRRIAEKLLEASRRSEMEALFALL